jgi:uncharacterized protein (TIGR01777 family)
MRIVIGGASGFIGGALTRRLTDDGHEVVRLVRQSPTGPAEFRWDPAAGELDPKALAGADAVVNLAGAGVGDKRWTDSYKRVIRDSRIDSTVTVSRALAKATAGPKILLNASAIGFYGDRGDEVLTEDSAAGDGFLADVARTWEAATESAEDAGVRVCHLRTGLVFGPGGGMLTPLRRLFKAGAGGRIGSGKQFQSWISLADAVSAIAFLAAADVSGAVNLTGPTPVRNIELTRALAEVLHRPALVPAPAFALKIALGGFASEVLSSARVMPTVLTEAGFQWAHPTVIDAIRGAVDG